MSYDDGLLIHNLADELLQVKVKSTKKLVVPFIGAGVTSAVDETISTFELIKYLKEKNRIPNWVEFKLDKVSQYSDIVNKLTDGRETVANYIVERQCKHRLTEFIPKENDADKSTHNPLWVLANLPIPIYITTNYDTLLESYLIEAKKTPHTIVSNWMGWFKNDKTEAEHGIDKENKEIDEDTRNDNVGIYNLINWRDEGYSVESPVVFHLHGVINNYRSMVLTEDNYIDFLVMLNGKEGLSSGNNLPVLPAPIAKIFSKNHLLFLGYSLNDINLNVMLRSLRKSFEVSRYGDKPDIPFAVQKKPEKPRIFQWVLEEKIESNQKLNPDQLKAFHEEFIQWINKVKNGALSGEEVWTKMNQHMEIPDLSDAALGIYETKVQEFITAALKQQADLDTEVIWSNVISFLNNLYEEYFKRSQP